MSRYVLHPGYVRSRADGDVHFVGVGQLAQLYGVRLADCVALATAAQTDEYYNRGARPGDVHLFPRVDGDYRLPAPPPGMPPRAPT